MVLTKHEFRYFDRVQFVGRHADELRKQGQCTTGVVQVSAYGESDPCVEVELDTIQNSGEGGGSVHRLYAPNWHITGTPIELSELGRTLRRIRRYRQWRDEQTRRPLEQRNNWIISRVESFLAENDRGLQVPLFI